MRTSERASIDTVHYYEYADRDYRGWVWPRPKPGEGPQGTIHRGMPRPRGDRFTIDGQPTTEVRRVVGAWEEENDDD